ncbi:MAG: hypothetical protein ABH883_00655, partial [Candidatus Omnitrophota bacterium]
ENKAQEADKKAKGAEKDQVAQLKKEIETAKKTESDRKASFDNLMTEAKDNLSKEKFAEAENKAQEADKKAKGTEKDQVAQLKKDIETAKKAESDRKASFDKLMTEAKDNLAKEKFAEAENKAQEADTKAKGAEKAQVVQLKKDIEKAQKAESDRKESFDKLMTEAKDDLVKEKFAEAENKAQEADTKAKGAEKDQVAQLKKEIETVKKTKAEEAANKEKQRQADLNQHIENVVNAIKRKQYSEAEEEIKKTAQIARTDNEKSRTDQMIARVLYERHMDRARDAFIDRNYGNSMDEAENAKKFASDDEGKQLRAADALYQKAKVAKREQERVENFRTHIVGAKDALIKDDFDGANKEVEAAGVLAVNETEKGVIAELKTKIQDARDEKSRKTRYERHLKLAREYNEGRDYISAMESADNAIANAKIDEVDAARDVWKKASDAMEEEQRKKRFDANLKSAAESIEMEDFDKAIRFASSAVKDAKTAKEAERSNTILEKAREGRNIKSRKNFYDTAMRNARIAFNKGDYNAVLRETQSAKDLANPGKPEETRAAEELYSEADVIKADIDRKSEMEKDMTSAKAAFANRDYFTAIQRADSVLLKAKDGEQIAKEALLLKNEALRDKQVAEDLAVAKNAFNLGKFSEAEEKARKVVNATAAYTQEHKEAERIWNESSRKIRIIKDLERAKTALEKGDFSGAITISDDILRSSSGEDMENQKAKNIKETAMARYKVSKLLVSAREAFARGEFESVVEAANKALSIDKSNQEALDLSRRAHVKISTLKEIAKTIERARKALDEGHFAIAEFEARTVLKSYDAENSDARKIINEAARFKAQKDVDALLQEARTALEEKNFDKAAENAEKTLNIAPKNEEAARIISVVRENISKKQELSADMSQIAKKERASLTQDDWSRIRKLAIENDFMPVMRFLVEIAKEERASISLIRNALTVLNEAAEKGGTNAKEAKKGIINTIQGYIEPDDVKLKDFESTILSISRKGDAEDFTAADIEYLSIALYKHNIASETSSVLKRIVISHPDKNIVMAAFNELEFAALYADHPTALSFLADLIRIRQIQVDSRIEDKVKQNEKNIAEIRATMSSERVSKDEKLYLSRMAEVAKLSGETSELKRSLGRTTEEIKARSMGTLYTCALKGSERALEILNSEARMVEFAEIVSRDTADNNPLYKSTVKILGLLASRITNSYKPVIYLERSVIRVNSDYAYSATMSVTELANAMKEGNIYAANSLMAIVEKSGNFMIKRQALEQLVTAYRLGKNKIAGERILALGQFLKKVVESPETNDYSEKNFREYARTALETIGYEKILEENKTDADTKTDEGHRLVRKSLRKWAAGLSGISVTSALLTIKALMTLDSGLTLYAASAIAGGIALSSGFSAVKFIAADYILGKTGGFSSGETVAFSGVEYLANRSELLNPSIEFEDKTLLLEKLSQEAVSSGDLTTRQVRNFAWVCHYASRHRWARFVPDMVFTHENVFRADHVMGMLAVTSITGGLFRLFAPEKKAPGSSAVQPPVEEITGVEREDVPAEPENRISTAETVSAGIIIGVTGITEKTAVTISGCYGGVLIMKIDGKNTGENVKTLEQYGRQYSAYATALLDAAGMTEPAVAGLVDEIIKDIEEKDRLKYVSDPGLVKLDADSVSEIQRTFAGIAARFPSMAARRVKELSVYESKFDRIAASRRIASRDKDLDSKLVELGRNGGTKVASFYADSIVELRWLADQHRKALERFRKTGKEYPVKLHIRLNDKRVTADNIADVLRDAEIDDVVKVENITLEAGKSIDEIYGYIESKEAIYGKVAPQDIVICDPRQDVVIRSDGTISDTAKELLAKKMLFVMMDTGVASQGYIGVIEILANGNSIPTVMPEGIAFDTMSVSVGEARYTFIVIKPIEPIDINQLRKEIERYEEILIRA